MNAATSPAHLPVMVDACLEFLAPHPGSWIIDGTFGAGGHSRALLEAGASVLAIDSDPQARAHASALGADIAIPAAPPHGGQARETRREAGRFRFQAGNFRDMEQLARAAELSSVAGVLLDLGVSSMQLDEGERGFAFRHDGPLDMRMAHAGRNAADIVNEAPFEELAALLWRYGEERHSRRIARAIVEARDRAPIRTTGQLAEVVASAYPSGPRRTHPARRTFQALRIEVNDELGALQEGLEAAARVLAPEGRLVVISYHSLEDRIVKRFFKDSPRLTALTRKPLEASEAEIRANPRARAAKLRAAERSQEPSPA
ncbi:MAG TPA: 16S rRNA (cytosine(1402)-N(4))-methyltransferase RsmH [Trueperaceae bacterium]|nr:16S rRNA (cytosine(1402)-N(4))-methyltransferase RsmH [Trueperaceae bacterium]